MELKTGSKLRSQVGPTEAVVVKAPQGDVQITCGGHAMIAADQSPQDGLAIDAAADAGAIIRIHPRRIISFGLENVDVDPHLLVPSKRNVS